MSPTRATSLAGVFSLLSSASLIYFFVGGNVEVPALMTSTIVSAKPKLTQVKSVATPAKAKSATRKTAETEWRTRITRTSNFRIKTYNRMWSGIREVLSGFNIFSVSPFYYR